MSALYAEKNMTVSPLLPLLGGQSLFTPCGNRDLLSLALPTDKFLDWLSFRPNNEVNQIVSMISYIGPAGAAGGTAQSGAIAACAEAPGVEYGVCEILLPDKGRLARSGPVRDLTENNRRLCDSRPIFFKDGTRVTDELTWSALMAGAVVRQDLKRLLITGNPNLAGQFAGLQALVNTGYTDLRSNRRCYSMDSIVVDWNNLPMTAKPNGVHSFVDYLVDVVRRIRDRCANHGEIAPGDMVLMLPSYVRNELLDAFTVWRIKPDDESVLDSYEARAFRDTLNGGLYGHGQIEVDGIPVPLISFDWGPISTSGPYFVGDVYVLTRQIGTLPILYGQFIDMNDPVAAFREHAGDKYRATDGGRFLVYWDTDGTCTKLTVLFRPNIYLAAPWAQARLQRIGVRRPLAPESPDPLSRYYAESYLVPAT